MAMYLVLMPIFEADFHPRSFGFRPARQAHQAVEAIREGLRIGKTEVVDADLAKYFDTIPHRKLMRQVARRKGNYFALAHHQRGFRQMNHFIAIGSDSGYGESTEVPAVNISARPIRNSPRHMV